MFESPEDRLLIGPAMERLLVAHHITIHDGKVEKLDYAALQKLHYALANVSTADKLIVPPTKEMSRSALRLILLKIVDDEMARRFKNHKHDNNHKRHRYFNHR